MPAYRVGDTVSKICEYDRCEQVSRLECKVIGVYTPNNKGINSIKVYGPSSAYDNRDLFVDILLKFGYTDNQIYTYIKELEGRDPKWEEKPVYVVEPVSSGNIPPYEEAIGILPTITPEIYEWLIDQQPDKLSLFFGRRAYLAIDADLL